MKWLNGYRIRFILIGFLVVIVLGSGRRAKADFVCGTPVNLGPTVNTVQLDGTQSISADGLSLYFQSPRPGGYGIDDLYVTTRASTDDDWGPAVNLGPTVNSSAFEGQPSISADGLSLYFGSDRPGGPAFWVTTRATPSDPWDPPVISIKSSAGEWTPSISADGLSLYFSSSRAGGSGDSDLWLTTRATLSDPWGSPVNLGATVNSSIFDAWPSISADGLALFFERGPGWPDDLWMTRRATPSDPWGLPVNLGPQINTSADDACPSISADGRTLYFSSDRPGGYGNYDIWRAPIVPIVDFNSDGIVDAADMCIMVDHWGENYSLCDMGPMPWGDGVVDIQDLLVLARYISLAPVAHWKLDETEGMYAIDSARDNDAFVVGGASWQSSSGQVDGALQLDGVSGCAIITGTALNPADGPFSIFAWVKGGAPGQVVVSQMGGTNWLCIDSSEGVLMTELAGPGSNNGPLQSQTVITDGAWHRIGFVWDGSHRILYVDNVVVAEDAQDVLEVSTNGLYIGTGKMMQSGTYFSGMIDDIRIYDRALTQEQIAALAQ